MSGYSQTGMHPSEVKRIKKALGALDSRVEMPESLRGDALLHKLEGIEPSVPTRKKIRELVLPRRGIRMFATYAAAFALVVGLLYGVILNRPAELAPGGMEINGPAIELPQLLDGGGISPFNTLVGTRLGEMGQFMVYHRPNDGINHSEAPNVLILLNNDGQVVSQVDIPNITDIISFSAQNDYMLTLYGTCANTHAYTYTFNFADIENPVTTKV